MENNKYIPTSFEKYPDYREIPGYSNYLIKNDGTGVKNKKTGRNLKIRRSTQGYPVLAIFCDTLKKSQKVFVHKLVALTFLGEPPLYEKDKATINHQNGDKTDNRPENLEWCSMADNLRHAFAIGLQDANMIPIYVFNEKNKTQIRYPSVSECARNLGVDDQTIHTRLKFGPNRVWSNLLRIRTEDQEFQPLTEQEVENSLLGYIDSSRVSVFVLDTKTNTETEYISICECARELGISQAGLHKRLKRGPDKVWDHHLRFRRGVKADTQLDLF